MLKNIFNRIKSEKQSTIKSQKNNQPPNKHHQSEYQPHQEGFVSTFNQPFLAQDLKIRAASEQSIVQEAIQKIRYWGNEQIPNIFNQTLSCPISHFNLLPHSKRKVKEIDLKKDKYPQYLEFMKELLKQELPSYNHILINHYPKGIGIMHHFDGPLYKDRVIVLSLGGPAIISFQSGYSKETQSMKMLLEDKSIHIFQHHAYLKYLHGIEDKKIDAFTFTIQKRSAELIGTKNGIPIKLKNEFNNFVYQVSESSIHNLSKLHSIISLIEKHLSSLVFEQQENYSQHFIEFDEGNDFHRLKGMFIHIKFPETQKDLSQKSRWKWKIQIERQQRISITIREKYLTSQF